MTVRVLLLTRYSRMGASSRLRFLQYIDYLESENFHITVECLFGPTYLQRVNLGKKRSLINLISSYSKRLYKLFSVTTYDVVWIEKEIFPYLPAFAEQILHVLKIPYVVDYDDATFHGYDRSKSILVRVLLGKKIDVVMRLSTCVVAGNKYIEKRAKLAGAKNTVLVPTVVDHTRYKTAGRRHDNVITVGWIGSPSTQKYLIEIAEPLSKLCLAHNARLLLVGANNQISRHFSGVNLMISKWDENTEAELVNQMDLGIMPLDDTPWARGKCGYKLLQYMACGLPVVASPVGVNSEIVDHGVTGFLSDTQNEWAVNVGSLLISPDLRESMGRKGRSKLENEYSLEKCQSVISHLLDSAIFTGDTVK